jgi:hypothetical protein
MLDFKRKYFYLRQGWAVIAPIFGFSNFIMLIYITLELDLPLYIFAPISGILIAVGLIIAGKTFREKQMSTDFNLSYFKATEAITTELIMWEQMEKLCAKNGVELTDSFKERKKLLQDRIK